MNCFVLGAGAWGTAIASVLARKGINVTLWCRRPERAAELRAGRHSLLPGFEALPGLHPMTGEELLRETRRGPYTCAISVVPTQHLRAVLKAQRSVLPHGVPWVSASKGVELGTFQLPSRIISESGVATDIGVLSGPSHAEEVVRGVPTAVVLGLEDRESGQRLQELLSSGTFRVYLNNDVTGVEWGGALKNVIALAAGIAVGRGFGDNTIAALVTRGAVEIARLGVQLGGRRDTFSGLSGIGDLIVTCFSKHSRNRQVGVRIGRGEAPHDVLAAMIQVVEGVHTARALVDMCRNLEVEMPIVEEVYMILHEGKDVASGVEALLRRSLKEE